MIIMDATMPNMGGVEATRHIKQVIPDTVIIFFSGSMECIEAGVAAGADGYVMKGCTTEEIVAEVRRIAPRR